MEYDVFPAASHSHFLVIACRGGMHNDTYCKATVIPRVQPERECILTTHHSMNDGRFEPRESPEVNRCPLGQGGCQIDFRKKRLEQSNNK